MLMSRAVTGLRAQTRGCGASRTGAYERVDYAQAALPEGPAGGGLGGCKGDAAPGRKAVVGRRWSEGGALAPRW